ncbi:MAG: hypothetical protein CVT98_09865, partial [Bacteroidetes bacterium HGW-Bacteroidetes-15]
MKKIYISLFVVLFFSIGLMAQTVLITEDFESFTAGDHIAQTAGAPWTTWSGATGGGEDPLVSTAQANGGANSINVVANNDCVVDLGNKTTGRYQIEFYIYVNAGSIGYFNLLTNFAGANSEWATQTYFYINGTGSVDANGEGAATFTFNHDEWIYVNYIVDLDDDFATLYIGGNEIISWQWTKGSFGGGVAATLDAVDFYGHTIDGIGSNYYIDDFTFTEQVIPEAPINLTATTNGDNIDLDWTAPSTAPDNYLIMRNSDVIDNTTTG